MPVNSVKVCARCGGENNRSASVCSHCGARLLNLDLASPSLSHHVDQLVDRQKQLLEAVDRFHHNEIGEEDFEDFLQAFGEGLREKKRKAFILNDEGEPEFDDGEDQEEWQDIAEFEHFRRGLDEINKFFQVDGDPIHFERGLEIVREGNEKLLNPAGKAGPEPAAPQATANSAACVLCSTENEVGAAVCSNCGAKLPKFDTTSVPQEKHTQVTERLDQFKKSVARLKSGQWSSQEFGEWLDQVQEKLRSRRETYQTVLTETGYGEYANDEVTLAAAGMQDYEAGIEEFWLYLDEKDLPDPSRLDRALEQITSGNEKINKAMVMNRSFRKEITEQFGYI